MTITSEMRYEGCLIGLAAGDAVGTTVEFKAPGSFPPMTDMVGCGPFGLVAGQWTDDTSMALCLAESLVTCREFNARDQMDRYVRWWKEGYLSSTGRCFDIGGTTSRALAGFVRTGEPFSGPADARQAGNGSLMRLAPVPLYFASDPAKAIAMSGESSRTTHAAKTCIDACRYFGGLIVGALLGVIKVELKAGNPYHGGVVDNLLAEWTGTPLALRVELTPDIANLPADFIVWHTSSVTAPANNTLEFSLLRNTTGTEVVNVQFPSLGITKRVVIDYPDVGTYSENDILISHPFLYASAGVYGLAAMQYAEDLQAGGMSYFKANAIQHSFWASAMASDPSIGPEYSIWFTTAHEYGNRRDGAEAFDTVMDLKNNSVGASVVCTDPSSGEIVWSMIESILLQKLTDGELWIVDEDSLLVIKSNGKKIYP